MTGITIDNDGFHAANKAFVESVGRLMHLIQGEIFPLLLRGDVLTLTHWYARAAEIVSGCCDRLESIVQRIEGMECEVSIAYWENRNAEGEEDMR